MADGTNPAISNPRALPYKVINGFKFPFDFQHAEDSLSYEAKPDDLFIVTYPKNGTTWVQQIVASILNDGEQPDGKSFEIVPYLEYRGKEYVESMTYPHAIKTHLPYDLQPKNPTAKYIIVMRNVKDTAVSYYHHNFLFPGYIPTDMKFSEFLTYFIKGEIYYGDYFDWILSWWPHRHDNNVLMLLYEDMKSDIKTNILKIAKFMGDQYCDKMIADDNKILNKVIERSSLKNMKKEINDQFKKDFVAVEDKLEVPIKDEYNFIRKGVIGDWKNHFNLDEDKLVQDRFHEKFDGTGLEHLWDNYDIFI